MTLYEYNLMGEEERTNHVWKYGTFLQTREEEDYKFVLYSLEEFYVEVVYSIAENRLINIRSFKSVTNLHPYIDHLDISKLL